MSGMSDDEAVPWLWAAERGDEHTDRLAALIRAAEKPAGLSPASRLRIWARLSRRRTAGFDRRDLLGLRWAEIHPDPKSPGRP